MSVPAEAPRSRAQLAIFAWGILGTVFVIAEPIFRLLTYAKTTLAGRELSPGEIAFGCAFLVFILYAEGYRGFQKRFSPRTVARAVSLAQNGRPLWIVLAPLYCMALVGASRRRLIASWLLVAGIVTVVLIVRHLPPTYRALVDVGVGLALSWGLASICVYSIQALRGKAMPVAADS